MNIFSWQVRGLIVNGYQRPPSTLLIWNHNNITAIGPGFHPIFPNVGSLFDEVVQAFFKNLIWFRLTETLGFDTIDTLLLAA